MRMHEKCENKHASCCLRCTHSTTYAHAHNINTHTQQHTQVVEKDLLVQEKEKLYMELKNILSRQPGPEVAEQLSIYQVRGKAQRFQP